MFIHLHTTFEQQQKNASTQYEKQGIPTARSMYITTLNKSCINAQLLQFSI